MQEKADHIDVEGGTLYLFEKEHASRYRWFLIMPIGVVLWSDGVVTTFDNKRRTSGLTLTVDTAR